MKNTCLIFILFLSTAVMLNSCKKKEEAIVQTELEKLPAATQVGANTFGALVNGKAFLPGNSLVSSTPAYQCNYIYTNGGYYLTVAGSYQSSAYDISQITLGTHQLAIVEGQTYILEDYNTLGKAFAVYDIILHDNFNTKLNGGQLLITKFDQSNQIVSGKFKFSAVNSKGDTIRVNEGRFDMKYTK